MSPLGFAECWPVVPSRHRPTTPGAACTVPMAVTCLGGWLVGLWQACILVGWLVVCRHAGMRVPVWSLHVGHEPGQCPLCVCVGREPPPSQGVEPMLGILWREKNDYGSLECCCCRAAAFLTQCNSVVLGLSCLFGQPASSRVKCMLVSKFVGFHHCLHWSTA